MKVLTCKTEKNVSWHESGFNKALQWHLRPNYLYFYDLKKKHVLCFIGEKELSAELEELYGDIDAVEFYTGLLVEQPRPGAIFGETMVEIGAPFSLKGLMGNPICSPEYWKPSTFGGRVGFDIVNSASLQKLICNNVKDCPFTSFNILRSKNAELARINTSSNSALDDVNPTVLLKEHTSEL